MKLARIVLRATFSILLLPIVGISIFAQRSNFQYPNNGFSSFRWQGVVDGESFIKVRGRQVQSETISGVPVQNQQYDFTDPLPRAPIQVELAQVIGRGRVNIVEQPRPQNDFTAVVRINDDQGGKSSYSFELRWVDLTRRDREVSSARNSEEVTWRGRVDGESIIRFSYDQVRYETINGRGTTGVNYRFSSPLPSQPTSVSLINGEGRGEITLIDQPNQNNNYTAAVRIRDQQGGFGSYAFTLTWNRPAYRGNDRDRYRDNDRDRYRDNDGGRGYFPQSQRQGVRWTGRVDGRDVLYIKGNQLRVEHQNGQPVREENYRFFQSLPFERRNVVVRKLGGRGGVNVIQQPSRENGFTAAILIEDRDGGSDRYDIEVDW